MHTNPDQAKIFPRIRGKFHREALSAPGDVAQLPGGWFAISHRWIDDRAARRRLHGRWFKLTSSYGTIFRAIKFAPNLKGGANKEEGAIVLDWPAWLELNGFPNELEEKLELSITRVRWWHWPKLAISHPDPAIQTSGWLGILSLALGIISLFLALLTL